MISFLSKLKGSSDLDRAKKTRKKSAKKNIQLVSSTKPRRKALVVDESSTVNCPCCGIVLAYPDGVSKIKCAICQVTTYVKDETTEDAMATDLECSVERLKAIIDRCYNSSPERILATTFAPVGKYLESCFHSKRILNSSFSCKRGLVDFDKLDEFYRMITELPTRQPFYRMLCASNDLLKHPNYTKNESFVWLLVLWANPHLRSCLTTNPRKNNDKFNTTQINTVSYELVKRCIAYQSKIKILFPEEFKNFTSHLKAIPKLEFLNQVETVNLYLTFQLRKIIDKKIKNESLRETRLPLIHAGFPSRPNTNTSCYNSLNMTAEVMTGSKAKNDKVLSIDSVKLRPFEYENDWHIQTAMNFLLLLYRVNKRRGNGKLRADVFYNILLDFLDFKQDFENWRKRKNISSLVNMNAVELWEYPAALYQGFSMCSYPFLLSLGVKISIMEYEVHRIMELEAERAFLKSIEKGESIDVYFKIQVSRKNITNDSLNCIRSRHRDLLKSLRVEFIDEPGIDAGGLRKEWFLLLTRSLFNPMNGLFVHVEESYMSWFAIRPILANNAKQDELYYLFGIVVGLAIFNSTILDLKFPKAFYKKLCGELLDFTDYQELYPVTAESLLKLLKYEGDDFAEVFGLTFETSFKDPRAEILQDRKNVNINIELCPGGSDIIVTQKNKHEFVKLWAEFYMTKSVQPHFDQFYSGFKQVCGQADTIGLFNAEELERLVCGNQEQDCYDFVMLRSVTKYTGGFTDKTAVVQWFWDLIQSWSPYLQKKLLLFVTGSDRVPATGISTLPFKISRLTLPHYKKLQNKHYEPLPLAHTCFNEVCLWEYKTKSALEDKLKCAVLESEGYGFK